LSYKILLFNRHNRIVVFAAAVIALLSAGCSSRPGLHESQVRSAAERAAAPDFTLKDEDGRSVQLSDYRGKVVLLNFWATWCGPCKIEIPWFVEFEREHKDQGFAVVGISMDGDGWQAVKPFISDAGINYRILMGNDSIAHLYGGVEALPTTFMIDRDGKIAAVHKGLVSKSIYENDLTQLLESPSGTRAAGIPAAVARAN
jgi:cytochrome c biogenesis protein CcmG/thiol:disulfide interchange protein DsbE